jgi:hypothetical protein
VGGVIIEKVLGMAATSYQFPYKSVSQGLTMFKLKSENKTVLPRVIEKEANINTKDRDGRTRLHRVAIKGEAVM